MRSSSGHEQEFPPAQPPQATAAEAVDTRSIRKRIEKEEVKGVSLFSRSERRAAKERASERAEAEAAAEVGGDPDQFVVGGSDGLDLLSPLGSTQLALISTD